MSDSVNNYTRVAAHLPVADEGTAGVLRALCEMGVLYDSSDAVNTNPALDVLAKVSPALVPGSTIEKDITRLLKELAGGRV